MGEVRVSVKLSNAMDNAMRQRELIPADEVRSETVEAVVATGAVRSCMPVDLMQKLGVRSARRINV